ncbi:MAG: phosphonate metabolism transcriptional regulator PhnF [Pseudomonadota bacterium]
MKEGYSFVTSPRGTRGLPLWQQILTTVGGEIDEGLYPPGAKLPTEAEMAQRFGVNRHTVRRALEGLREDGRIYVRRGSGAYVTQGRFDYDIGPRTRLSDNIEMVGRKPESRILRIEELGADKRAARALKIEEGDPVIVRETISLADEVPITYKEGYYPIARLPGIQEALSAETSVTRALTRIGFGDYRRESTRLTAMAPGAMVARHLQMPENHAVLLAESINTDTKGTIIEFGRTWFCSDRVQLVIDRSTFAGTPNEPGED